MTDLLFIVSQELQPLVEPTLHRLCDKTQLRYQLLTPEECVETPAPAQWSPRCVALLDTQLSPEDSWWPDSAVRVIPAEHPLAASALAAATPGTTRTTRSPKVSGRAAARVMVRFGQTAPLQPGDFGMMRQDGLDWLVRALPSSEPTRRRNEEFSEPAHLQTLMPVAALGDIGALSPQWVLGILAGVVCSGTTLATALHALSTGATRQVAAA